MKNIQTGTLKILMIISSILTSSFVHANDLTHQLRVADSLFIKKQYTQSFEIYQRLQQNGRHSPAMLLKMAFIQEGLGHIGLSLYYLNLYYLASGDNQALDKLQELASKNRLEGYERSDSNQILFVVQKYSYYFSIALAALALFLVAILFRAKKKESRPSSIGVLTLLVLILLTIQVNVSYQSPAVIIIDSNTYLMSGPSAGANVVTKVTEGHKLKIKDQKDVWLKVTWQDKDAFVKENQVIKVVL